jgi:hypothetical protein
VVRQRSAKPLFTGSNPVAASSKNKGLALFRANPFFFDVIAKNAISVGPCFVTRWFQRSRPLGFGAFCEVVFFGAEMSRLVAVGEAAAP